VPLATSMVPPDAPRLMPRLALSVKLAVVAIVPPLRVSEPAVAEPGAVPRLVSAEMLSVPALTVVVPEYVLTPPRTSVPAVPLAPCVRLCDPPIAPPRVTVPASSVNVRFAPSVIGALNVFVPDVLSIPMPDDPVRVSGWVPEME